jgi:hypothetical protein
MILTILKMLFSTPSSIPGLIRLVIATNPERFRRMATIAVFLLFSATVFASGWFLGRMLLSADCEREKAEERITALESITETYQLLAELEQRHATSMADVEKSLLALDRSVDRTIAGILKSNPELARWYHEPINRIERAAMYPEHSATGGMQHQPTAHGLGAH